MKLKLPLLELPRIVGKGGERSVKIGSPKGDHDHGVAVDFKAFGDRSWVYHDWSWSQQKCVFSAILAHLFIKAWNLVNYWFYYLGAKFWWVLHKYL